MIKRTAPTAPEAVASSASNGAGPGSSEYPEREFYTRKIEQALGSRIEALTHPSVLQAVEAHFRQNPERAHDPEAVVAAACHAKKAQVTAERERGGVRV